MALLINAFVDHVSFIMAKIIFEFLVLFPAQFGTLIFQNDN